MIPGPPNRRLTHIAACTLAAEGGGQMIVCEIIVGTLIYFQTYEQPDNTAMASAILAFICFYVAGFAWSW